MSAAGWTVHSPDGAGEVAVRRGRGPRLLSIGMLAALALLPTTYLLRPTDPPRPDTVRVYVAVPAGIDINYGVADAALHETDLAIRWLEAQAGQQLQGGDVRFAEIVTLSVDGEFLMGDVERAFAIIHDEIMAHGGRDDVFPVILADVRTQTGTTGLLTCGLGGTRGLVMLLGNCPGDELSIRSTWGSRASYTIAHELVHGLGAAAPCGASTTPDGHVSDDPTDILYSGPGTPVRGGPVTLDAAGDDYHRTQIPGCPDIAESPLWAD